MLDRRSWVKECTVVEIWNYITRTQTVTKEFYENTRKCALLPYVLAKSVQKIG
jgi:hypothetical protein